MPRSTAGFKDEASANEVERWLNRQESLGKPVRAHHDVLATAGATVRRGGRDDAKVAAPNALTSRVTFAPTPSGTPGRPSSAGASPTASGASARRSSVSAVSVPGSRAIASRQSRSFTRACEAGRARMGIDPATNQPNRAFYGGFAGARSANAECFDAPHDPAARATLRPALASARAEKAESQTRSRYAESLGLGVGGKADAKNEALHKWWQTNALQSTTRAFDAPVAAAAARVPGAAADAEAKRRGFVDAARATRLYYGDLFSDEGARRVDARLRDAPPDEAVEVFETLRAVHAGTASQRRRTQSATAADFRQGFVPTEADTRRRGETARRAKRARAPPEDPAVTRARVKRKAEMIVEETNGLVESRDRIEKQRLKNSRRTLGVSRDPTSVGVAKISCTDGALACFGNDFESAEVPRFASSYAEKQCAHMSEIVAQTRAGKHLVKHEEKATMPFGEGLGVPRRFLEGTHPGTGDGPVVPRSDEAPLAPAVIGIWRNRPGTVGDGTSVGRLYPVPRYLTRRRPESSDGRRDASSTSRRAFAPRSAEFGEKRAAEVRATIAANKTKRSESRVPLGNKGITDHPRHRMTSSYVADYVETHARRVEARTDAGKAEKENETGEEPITDR